MLRIATLLPFFLCAGVAGTAPVPRHPGAAPSQEETGQRATDQQEPEPDETDAPGPLHKIAGLRGIRVTSRISYADPEAAPHLLEACYAFPDRTRTRLAPAAGGPQARRLTYRFGKRFWAVDPGTSKSRELTGRDKRSAQLELELRRAVFLWPDGFDWKPAAGGMEAELGPLGRLRATFAKDQSERPVAVAVLSALDAEGQALTDLTWKRSGKRQWPAHLVLRYAGEMVWEEEVLEVDTVTRFVDAWFQPTDQRRATASKLRKRPRAFDLPARAVRRLELPTGLTPAAALERADAWHLSLRAALSEQQLQLDPSPYLELDAQGRPQSVLLLLQRPPETLPEGWVREPERAAWGLFLGGIGQFASSDLILLRAAAGNDLRHAGVPFLRIRPAGSEPRRAELVLPLGG